MARGQKVVGVYIGKRRLSVQTTPPGSLFTATFVSSEKEDSDTQLPQASASSWSQPALTESSPSSGHGLPAGISVPVSQVKIPMELPAIS